MAPAHALTLALLLTAAACAAGDPEPAGPPACAAGTCAGVCEAGACVDPWRYGTPKFSACPGEARATAAGLAAKAAHFDEVAQRLHVHPAMKWVLDVRLAPGAREATATSRDVAVWHSGENDGLWSALYLASQAYRFAATRSAAALANVRLLLAGEVERMAITGVPGLFTRQLIPPGVSGLACPAEREPYQPDPDKRANRWVRIGAEGCVQVTDPPSGEWVTTSHCGLAAFAGWCWLDNISQDEYVGHLFALGAVARLVDDAAVQTTARDLVEQIGLHLMRNDLRFIDWDGRPTRWGRLYPGAEGDAPGYLAVMALDFIKLAAVTTGRDDLRDYYEGCLLQQAGPRRCLPWLDKPAPFTSFLPQLGIFAGPDACLSNWNDISMLVTNLHHLIWYERDAGVRAALQQTLDRDVMRASSPRSVLAQRNAWFDFMWAAQKQLGPGSDGPAYQAVEDAICQLRQFPASKEAPSRDLGALQPHACDDRFGNSLGREPFGAADRCPATFLWWGNPYERGRCDADPLEVRQPGDYLLAYWMGRYYGFIPETL